MGDNMNCILEKEHNWLRISLIIVFLLTVLLAGCSSGGKRCAICGKKDDLRQITAKTSSGEWDENWYCAEHYADAWQYYYGN